MSKLDDKAIDAMNVWADHIEAVPGDWDEVRRGFLDNLSNEGRILVATLAERIGRVAKAERKRQRRARETQSDV